MQFDIAVDGTVHRFVKFREAPLIYFDKRLYQSIRIEAIDSVGAHVGAKPRYPLANAATSEGVGNSSTAFVRLHLFRLLAVASKAGQLVYCDTDSVLLAVG